MHMYYYIYDNIYVWCTVEWRNKHTHTHTLADAQRGHMHAQYKFWLALT